MPSNECRRPPGHVELLSSRIALLCAACSGLTLVKPMHCGDIGSGTPRSSCRKTGPGGRVISWRLHFEHRHFGLNDAVVLGIRLCTSWVTTPQQAPLHLQRYKSNVLGYRYVPICTYGGVSWCCPSLWMATRRGAVVIESVESRCRGRRSSASSCVVHERTACRSPLSSVSSPWHATFASQVLFPDYLARCSSCVCGPGGISSRLDRVAAVLVSPRSG